MVIKSQNVANVIWGDTLTNGGFVGKTFDLGISNPPFGLEWTQADASRTPSDPYAPVGGGRGARW